MARIEVDKDELRFVYESYRASHTSTSTDPDEVVALMETDDAAIKILEKYLD
jgi:hypothetical protein